MADICISKDKLEAYKCCGNEAVNFKLVRNECDLLDESTTFKPEMCHQIFGESETIFGYKDLKVAMYYSAAKLETYLDITYTDKVTQEKNEICADDVVKLIAEHIPAGFMTNMDEFVSVLSKDANFKPFGDKKHSYSITKDGQDRTFEVYQANVLTPGFVDWHNRLQTFLLWYIDAASYIDTDDDRWNYYLLFEKYQFNGNPMYATVGYMTIYNYYAYPERIRPRISQLLILPPYQRQGHGSLLIQTFYNAVVGDNEVLDVTVEDPSEEFQRVRDYVDARNCMKLPSFQPECLREGFSDDMTFDAQQKLKINKKQARRVYEILRLHATDTSNSEDVTAYRLDIKRRLNIPFQKNGRDFDKLQKVLQPEELAAATNSLPTEQRQSVLEKVYQGLVVDYRHVLERIASS